jgi:hypothetical protein
MMHSPDKEVSMDLGWRASPWYMAMRNIQQVSPKLLIPFTARETARWPHDSLLVVTSLAR